MLVSRRRFKELSADLAERIRKTMEEFGEDHRLVYIQESLFRQRSSSPEEDVIINLNLGFDVWPECIADDLDPHDLTRESHAQPGA